MDDPWKVVGELAARLHSDRTAPIGDAVLHLKTIEGFDQERVERPRESWAAAPRVGPSEIHQTFRGAAEVAALIGAKLSRRNRLDLP